jgi:hypothetical protein
MGGIASPAGWRIRFTDGFPKRIICCLPNLVKNILGNGFDLVDELSGE